LDDHGLAEPLCNLFAVEAGNDVHPGPGGQRHDDGDRLRWVVVRTHRGGIDRNEGEAEDSPASQLLSTRQEQPDCRPADQRDEFAPRHSITSSARARSVGGMVRPSAFAVLRLMASSYLFGACTGRSAGFAPFNIRLT